MSKKPYIVSFVCILVVSLFVTDLLAFEIPGYIKDPQDIKNNVINIIKYNTPDATSGETVDTTQRQKAMQLHEYIAGLYGKAIATRAEYIGTEEASSGGLGIDVGEIGDAVDGVGNEKLAKAASTATNVVQKAATLAKSVDSLFESLASGDKNQALQQGIKESMRQNAIMLNKVVALEAEIMHLEAFIRLNKATSILGNRPVEGE